jgi:hypothetical protein
MKHENGQTQSRNKNFNFSLNFDEIGTNWAALNGDSDEV